MAHARAASPRAATSGVRPGAGECAPAPRPRGSASPRAGVAAGRAVRPSATARARLPPEGARAPLYPSALSSPSPLPLPTRCRRHGRQRCAFRPPLSGSSPAGSSRAPAPLSPRPWSWPCPPTRRVGGLLAPAGRSRRATSDAHRPRCLIAARPPSPSRSLRSMAPPMLQHLPLCVLAARRRHLARHPLRRGCGPRLAILAVREVGRPAWPARRALRCRHARLPRQPRRAY
eukprot:5038946-Pleurochrysis_carterae.AAC.1